MAETARGIRGLTREQGLRAARTAGFEAGRRNPDDWHLNPHVQPEYRDAWRKGFGDGAKNPQPELDTPLLRQMESRLAAHEDRIRRMRNLLEEIRTYGIAPQDVEEVLNLAIAAESTMDALHNAITSADWYAAGIPVRAGTMRRGGA